MRKIKDIIFSRCIGVVSAAIVMPKHGKLILLSNNGSLYYGEKMLPKKNIVYVIKF